MSQLTFEQLWNEVLKVLTEMLSELTVVKYFGGSRALRVEGSKLVVELAEGQQNGKQIEGLFGNFISAALERAGGEEVTQVVFCEKPVPVAQQVVEPARQDAGDAGEETLMETLTFDRFVEGPCNQFALAMARMVAQKPGDKQNGTNPLFMYGPTGVGKTHLLHAIGNMAKELKPSLRVLYVTSERLTNEYMQQWRGDEQTKARAIEAFQRKYRKEPNILLVDDIQYLSRSEGLQNEFFSIFNDLKEAGRQIVMTSDRAPTEIPNIMDRLVSRFQSGISTNVDIPGYETRYNILELKLRGYPGVTLSREVMEFIARRVSSSVRALEGALSTAVRYAQTVARGREYTVTVDALEKSVLKQFLMNEETIVQLTSRDIIEKVCRYYDVVPARIFGEGREREVALPRQMAMFLCRKMTSDSLPEIGKLFNRKHSTVSHACTTVQALYKNGDNQTVTALKAILTDLGLPISALN
ncbi:MAG: chromosomal replication initiator protein DnaA [Candidatus Spyradenecus sp.]